MKLFELNHKFWFFLDCLMARSGWYELLITICAYVIPIMFLWKLGNMGVYLTIFYVMFFGASRILYFKNHMNKLD